MTIVLGAALRACMCTCMAAYKRCLVQLDGGARLSQEGPGGEASNHHHCQGTLLAHAAQLNTAEIT